MDPENKENVNQVQYIDNIKDISVDSLTEEKHYPQVADEADNEHEISITSPIGDLSFGPALIGTSSFDSPALLQETNNQKPLAQDGDTAGFSSFGNQATTSDGAQQFNRNAIIKETEEYADDLARELINDTNQLVRSEHSVADEVNLGRLQEDNEKEHEVKNNEEKSNSQSADAAFTLDTQRDKDINQQEVDLEKPIVGFEENNKPLVRGEEVRKEQQQEEQDNDNHNYNNNRHTEEDTLESNQNNNNTNTDDSLRLVTNTNHDAHLSFQTAAGNSLLVDCDKLIDMEFTKNYSDDLLMDQNDGLQHGGESPSAATDLADFELPPYSGFSTGSEPKQQSPVKRLSASSLSAAPASSSNQVSAAPPDLTAVKNLLMSGYSRVSHVFYWKKPIETGIFLIIGITLTIALSFFSIISVVAYSALGIILTSGLIRLFKSVMKMLNRSPDTPLDHIWDKALSLNVSMSPEKTHELLDASLGNMNASLVYFKQVLLVEDKFATFKFALFLYLLTYIGAWFNGMTLITISYLALFSMPIFYEKNKTRIDGYLNLAIGRISSTISMVTNKASSLTLGSQPVPSTSGSRTKKQD